MCVCVCVLHSQGPGSYSHLMVLLHGVCRWSPGELCAQSLVCPPDCGTLGHSHPCCHPEGMNSREHHFCGERGGLSRLPSAFPAPWQLQELLCFVHSSRAPHSSSSDCLLCRRKREGEVWSFFCDALATISEILSFCSYRNERKMLEAFEIFFSKFV